MRRYSLLFAIACTTLAANTLTLRVAEAGHGCGRVGCMIHAGFKIHSGYGAHYPEDYVSNGLTGTGYYNGISLAGVNLNVAANRTPSGAFVPGISTNDVGNTAYKRNGFGGYAGYGTKH
jgi:hypothetical protein